MKTLILVLLLVTSSVFADEWQIGGVKIHHDEWTTADTVRHSVLLGLDFVDYRQTIYISHHLDKFSELGSTNMGKNPSPRDVNRYFEKYVLAQTAIAYLLPKDWRAVSQYIFIGDEWGNDRHNRLIGIHFSM